MYELGNNSLTTDDFKMNLKQIIIILIKTLSMSIKTINFDSFSIQIDENNYLNCTQFYKQFDIVFKNYRNRATHKEIEEIVSKKLKPNEELYYVRGSGNTRQTYCHPLMIKYIVDWKKPELYSEIFAKLNLNDDDYPEYVRTRKPAIPMSKCSAMVYEEKKEEVIEEDSVVITDTMDYIEVEKEVYNKLQTYFPLLENCSTIPHSCDLYDPMT